MLSNGRSPLYVDLFAGCGGLSLGLEKAGFELLLAVEKSPMAAETFYHNLIERIEQPEQWARYLEKGLREQADARLVVAEVADLLADDTLIDELRAKDIDLVAGGPPCQGFSMAGRRNPDDKRNELPWQFLDFVDRVRPKTVIIENVVGINHDFDKHGKPAPFTQLGMALAQTGNGYEVQRMRLNAQHFGVPQHRPRMAIVGVRKDIATRLVIRAEEGLWRSEQVEHQPDLAPRVNLEFVKRPRTVDDALWDINQDGYSTEASGPHRDDPGDYATLMRRNREWFPAAALDAEEAPPTTPPNNTPRRHSTKTARRFRLYQELARLGIRSNVVTTPADSPAFAAVETLVRREIAEAQEAGRQVFPWLMPSGEILAESADGVIRLLDELHTKKHSQRALDGDRPSPTVLTLPDDFIHYREPRIHTVREMARLQSFPDSFVFRSKETTGSDRRRFEVPQYTQVGNAVPPMMAKALGERLIELFSSDCKSDRD